VGRFARTAASTGGARETATTDGGDGAGRAGNGTEYVADLTGTVAPVASDQLGAVVGRVECRLSRLQFRTVPGPAVDGDAAFLDVGTQVRAIRGHAPSRRVAAQIGGVNRVYLAQPAPRRTS
jgi:hypothetical protein